MTVSPQSQSVLDRLLSGERVASGDVSIGPLDASTSLLLLVLIKENAAINRESGAAQAKKLRELYLAARATRPSNEEAAEHAAEAEGAPTPNAQDATHVEPEVPEPAHPNTLPAAWKLVRLTCRAIRGIDPSGEPLEFPFDTRPTLILGPNGSGKSSLLGAIVWVLTGRVITDSGEDSEVAALYGQPRAGDDRGARLCEWPVVVSLPPSGNPAAVTPECWAELELQSTDGIAWFVRRTLSTGLETSSDGASWHQCANLSEHGIEPLDLQLSLLAPTVFGRLTIDQAKDTRTLLSLMLGYDDLEALGEFASKLASNRTRLANEERGDLGTHWEQLKEKLRSLPNMLPAKSDLRDRLSDLAQVGQPTKEAIAEIGTLTKQQIETAEASLAELLGLTEQGKAPPVGIADRLTTAINAIEMGVWANFPSVAAIRTETALPEKEGADPPTRLSRLIEKTAAFLSSAQTRIAQRLQWWRKETEPGSKAALRLRAAQVYDPESDQCPVCGQPIAGLPVGEELVSLKRLDPELQHELRIFFRDLVDELKGIIPDDLIAIAESSPEERILQDWKIVRETTTGSMFESITTRFEEPIQLIAGRAQVVPSDAVALLPPDVEPEFAEPASAFAEVVRNAQVALDTLKWSKEHLQGTNELLHNVVCRSDDESAPSLLVALSKGKQAAADVEPLATVRTTLREAYKARETIATKAANLAVLGELETSLDQLKPLAKFAANEVRAIFGSIRDRTIDNWRLLYPESSSGLDPARLLLGKGRDKTVEALLGCGTYEAPGQFFANAGLQRAIALSFFFALLEKHPGGLAFVVMDDPILSLDEDHRESWSTNLLKPTIERTQVILATHQRQYLNNCKHDFRDGVVVELNPRSRSRRMSWRPGFRLDRAEEELQRAPTNAPTELRKYREELLYTLDAYSPGPFFNAANLTDSLRDYAKLAAPHPLAGRGQEKIVAFLNQPEVTRVLDPGSHHLTEADVTTPMSQQCLNVLRQCNEKLLGELDRLERLRAHERRGRALPAMAEGSLVALDAACWANPIGIRMLGRAAAKQDSWVCDESDDARGVFFPPGTAVLALAETLDPVVRPGQWLLVTLEDTPVRDGDLVVAQAGGRRLLRRAWAYGPEWHFTSLNPVHPSRPVISPRVSAPIRKIWGVLYEPLRSCGSLSVAEPDEWQPRADFDPTWLAALHAIAVEGNSLEPLARRSQKVLVADKQAPSEATLEQGSLAVLETNDDSVGNVIKRVFRRDDHWILVSPNPVEPHEPILLSPTNIVAVWPLRGVLLEIPFDSEA